MTGEELFREFLEGVLGRSLEDFEPQMLSGMQVISVLWPLNDVFRPVVARIRSIKYDPRFETEADDALRGFLVAPAPATWSEVSPGAWRVLLERHQQALMVAAANEAAGNPLMPIPAGLPDAARLGAAIAFLLYGMKLPFAIADRSELELPIGRPLASLRPH